MNRSPLAGRISGASTLGRGATILAFAVPVAAYLWLISRYGVDSLYADQWSDLALIRNSYAGTLSVGMLWAQHGDHRMFFPKLIVIVLARTTHYSIVFEEYLSAVMLTTVVALLMVTHRRRLSIPWVYYLPVVVVLLSWAQAGWVGNNTLWGFQMAWYLVLLALAVALYLLDSPRFNRFAFVGAAVAALVGSYSSLQGLLIWPAALVLMCKRGRPRWAILSWITCGLLAIAFYFYDFRFGTDGSTPSYAFAHPIAAIEFFFFEIGDLVGLQVPNNPSVGDYTVPLLGIIIFCLACWTLIEAGPDRDVSGTTPIERALIVYGLLFALITMIGRLQLGLQQAGESRYSTFDALILVGCYLAFLGRARLRVPQESVMRDSESSGSADARNHTALVVPLARLRFRLTSPIARSVAGAALAGTILVQVILGTQNGLAGARSWHHTELYEANVVVNIAKAPDALLAPALGFGPASYIRQLVNFARTHHLGIFGTSEAARLQRAQLQREGLPVEDQPPLTTVISPRSGAILKGTQLLVGEASSIAYGVTKVEFELTGSVLGDKVIAKAYSSLHGWLGRWNTSTVPNGSYMLRSIAYGSLGGDGESPPVPIVVSN